MQTKDGFVCPKIVRAVRDSVPRGGCMINIAPAGDMAALLVRHSRNLQGTHTRTHTLHTSNTAVIDVAVHGTRLWDLQGHWFLSVAGKRWGVVIQ